MTYAEDLTTTAAACEALAGRTEALAARRRRDGRGLAVATRTTLAAVAVRLRATADDLDRLATVRPSRAEEVVLLVAEARRLGVRA